MNRREFLKGSGIAGVTMMTVQAGIVDGELHLEEGDSVAITKDSVLVVEWPWRASMDDLHMIQIGLKATFGPDVKSLIMTNGSKLKVLNPT